MVEYLTFISHSHLDKDIASKLQLELDNFGLSSFVAHEDIEPNEEWAKEIVKVAGECRIFLYLLTENFYKSTSRWPDHEVGMGISKRALCIPLSLEGVIHVDPYGALAHIQRVKINEESYYDSTFVVKFGKRKIGLSRFVLTKWYDKEGSKVIEYFISELSTVKDFKSGNAVCRTLRLMDRWNWLSPEQVNEIVRYGTANNQVFNLQYSTASSEFIKELAEKYTGDLEKGLLERLQKKIQIRENSRQVIPSS